MIAIFFAASAMRPFSASENPVVPITTDEHHRVFADEVAAANRVEGDFLRVALAGIALPAMHEIPGRVAAERRSDDFAELRPRVTWDRIAGTVRARPGAQRIAVINGGTITDRGLYGVFLQAGGEKSRRVGELDEEMVFESRVGEVFLLGASSWRIDEITHDRVLVTPAPGEPGKMPFWHGDRPGRPRELGRAMGHMLGARVASRLETDVRPAVITDLRLRLELDYLRPRFELIVVRLVRSDAARATSGWTFMPDKDEHYTETELDAPTAWTEVVANDGTEAELARRAETVLSLLLP